MGAFDTLDAHGPLPIRIPEAHPVHRGKRFVVTGAARGLGLAVATLLARQGARLWLVDVLESELEAAAATLDCSWCCADVADAAAAEAAVSAAHAALGGLDGAVNIAGIVRHHDPLAITRGDWERQQAVNVFGSYEIARAVAVRMIADGVPGAIVNTASEAGKVGHVDSLAYSATKAAVISMTRMLSKALAHADINVNCVCPGGLPTAMLHEVAEAYATRVGSTAEEVFPHLTSGQFARQTTEAEVAEVYSFLLSDAARTIRGQAINADGGDTPY